MDTHPDSTGFSTQETQFFQKNGEGLILRWHNEYKSDRFYSTVKDGSADAGKNIKQSGVEGVFDILDVVVPVHPAVNPTRFNVIQRFKFLRIEIFQLAVKGLSALDE